MPLVEEIMYIFNIDSAEKMRIPTWSQAQRTLSRKKLVIQNDDTKLAKVLSTLDLTALGVGSTLGVGVYVLAGEVAKTTAGPAVIISFLIAALASILAGLCYAEFGARVPKAGSAYVYSYVCIGEFFAFIIGWNLILEYLIGSASCVKALFLYFDNMANKTMSNYFMQTMPMNGGQIATYADIFSLALSIVFAVALAFGAKESSLVNNVFTLVNIIIVLLVIISGIFKADAANWNRTAQEAMGIGMGGFAPYGIKGIIKGAAKCFYGFIGFDCIATAGEEAKTPQKSIPIGVVMSLLIVFLSYFGMSTVLTMMLPYYEQDTTAPLPHVYEQIGWTTIKYIVSIGACCGLFSSLLGAMFPLPRIIYAMASDGLLFRTLSKVHPKFQTPFMGTLLAGAVTGILACIFELSKLTEMMSIGTLLAYSMVAACVLVLRYAPDSKKTDVPETITLKSFIKQTMSSQTTYPTKLTSSVVSWLIIIFFTLCFILSGLMTIFEDNLYRGEAWLISICVVLGIFLLLLLFIVSFQPTSDMELGFKVPLVPWIPGISIFINIYLMTHINKDTWLKYVYWMAIGLVIYLTYGIWHSNERSPPLTSTVTRNGSIKQNDLSGNSYYGATVASKSEDYEEKL
ncbi:cationic amino acid transporter 2 [Anthonomus grandis grandis]|uniref:cationic amino acid transporter 2 n=1 Tax=Anthonomus grandis grandis TaxID=2921223 RepID=UPI0021651EC5|nr:cationic amino acid transporter 2 [Anthonomus grandis grandis]